MFKLKAELVTAGLSLQQIDVAESRQEFLGHRITSGLLFIIQISQTLPYKAQACHILLYDRNKEKTFILALNCNQIHKTSFTKKRNTIKTKSI